MAGKGQDAAISALEEDGFDRKKMEVKHEESMTVKKGLVIKTDPAAGTTGNHASEIVIYISSGVGKTKMPDLVGKTKSEAEKLIKDAGLVGKVVEVEKAGLAEENIDKVIEQSIEKDKELDKGTTVEYMIAIEAKVQIPESADLVGKSKNQVDADLRNLGLEPDWKYSTSYEYDNNMVISVEGAGTSVKKGSKVKVTVSTGPGPGTGTGTGTGTGSGTGTGTGTGSGSNNGNGR